ncbi:MAG: DUF4382 domain-containing protein [Longimicrobiales bacterium]|nr:DUF4382 domain-containing protein [Longimicrobiales bacterium]
MKFSGMKGTAILALLLTLPAAACDEATDTRFGTVDLKLTDATSHEVVEAWVTFTDIYLQGESGETDPPEGRTYLLREGSETHELTALANSVADLVVGQEVPTGSYGQLRVVISEACIATSGGSVFSSRAGFDRCGAADGTLQIPSLQETGVKVLLNGLQVEGGQEVLLLDFDVSQSFDMEAGMADVWVMTPVIRGADIGLTAGIDVTLSEGDVELPAGYALGDFSATMLPTTGDDAQVAFTDDDGNGTFEVSFQFLIPGDGPFEVRLNAPEGLDVTVDPGSPATVSPASGETAAIDWTLQSATEAQ